MNLKKLLRSIILKLNEWAGIKTTLQFTGFNLTDETTEFGTIAFRIENLKVMMKVPRGYDEGENRLKELLWDQLKESIPRAAIDVHLRDVPLGYEQDLRLATGRIRFLVPERMAS